MAKTNRKPRDCFRDFINYLHDGHLDFEQMEEDKVMETYYKAMEYYREVVGNSLYTALYKEDLLMLIQVKAALYSTAELAEILEIPIQSVSARTNKLIRSGLMYSFLDKKQRYYRLTPYGEKELEKEIMNPESLLYEKEN